MTILSIDIGGTNFRIGCLDDNHNLIQFEKKPTSSIFHSEDVLNDLASFLLSYGEDISFDALAIGFPATLDKQRKKVVQAPNISFMENLPVCEFLQEKLHVPVYAERDVTFALCYDMHNLFR